MMGTHHILTYALKMSGAETANGNAFEKGMSYLQQLGKSFLDIDLGP